LAFDADGTLWRGDVGDAWFFHVLEQAQLTQSGYDLLRAKAKAAKIELSDHAAKLGRAVYAAFEDGKLREEEICELSALVYAGHGSESARVQAQRAASDFVERIRPELKRVVEWARSSHTPLYVVSASPRHVVEVAAAACGVRPEEVIAATAREQDGVLTAELTEPVPYGAAKLSALRSRTDRPLLAAFGDSGFDAELLEAATLRVAVCPKPDLLERRVAGLVALEVQL
jgi:phosphatidylglycerophosphatase C